jgi:hypothetical protein
VQGQPPDQGAVSIEIHDLRTAGGAEIPHPAASACRCVGRFGRATEGMERDKDSKLIGANWQTRSLPTVAVA